MQKATSTKEIRDTKDNSKFAISSNPKNTYKAANHIKGRIERAFFLKSSGLTGEGAFDVSLALFVRQYLIPFATLNTTDAMGAAMRHTHRNYSMNSFKV